MGKDADIKSAGDFIKLVKEKNPGEDNFLQTVEEFVESVWDVLQESSEFKDANILSRLVEPERMFVFRVPWTDDEGTVQVNRGFRVEFNSALGPYKGGLRLTPSVNVDTLKFLGFEQTMKNALTTLPLGGGKGGSDFDPKGRSDNEVMRFCQSFMTELQRYIGPDTDVPAGDIGVGAREIGFMFGQYKRIRNEFTGILTGKSPLWGGSKGRAAATGHGVVYFAEAMLEQDSSKAGTQGRSSDASEAEEKRSGSEGESESVLSGKTVTVSGSGQVAQYVVNKCIQRGAKVLTMSDSDGTVVVKDGFTEEMLEAVMELKNKKRGRMSEFVDDFGGDAEYKEGETPWSVKCDIAIPAATQNELDGDAAEQLVKNGVSLVCEAANMPCTPDAIKKFQKEDVLFGPAKAANAGGVAVSGLEMSQNAQGLYWTAKEVDKKLHDIMLSIHEACVADGGGDKEKRVNYVKGANVAAFKKVAQAMLDQGSV